LKTANDLYAVSQKAAQDANRENADADTARRDVTEARGTPREAAANARYQTARARADAAQAAATAADKRSKDASDAYNLMIPAENAAYDAAEKAATAADANPPFSKYKYDSPESKAYWAAQRAPDKALEDALNNTVKYAQARVDAAAAAGNKAEDEAVKAAADAAPLRCGDLAKQRRDPSANIDVFGGRRPAGSGGPAGSPMPGGYPGGPEG